MKKIRILLSLNWKTKLLLLEAFIFLGWARILKGMQFSKIAGSLGVEMEETTFNSNAEQTKTLKRISEAIQIISRHTTWESKCLVKAIAGQKMLNRRYIESTLYLGTAKDVNGDFIAHAWLRSGPFYISGSEGMEIFTVVAKFANGPKLNKLEGENYG